MTLVYALHPKWLVLMCMRGNSSQTFPVRIDWVDGWVTPNLNVVRIEKMSGNWRWPLRVPWLFS